MLGSRPPVQLISVGVSLRMHEAKVEKCIGLLTDAPYRLLDLNEDDLASALQRVRR